jgi:hypothetical protein
MHPIVNQAFELFHNVPISALFLGVVGFIIFWALLSALKDSVMWMFWNVFRYLIPFFFWYFHPQLRPYYIEAFRTLVYYCNTLYSRSQELLHEELKQEV